MKKRLLSKYTLHRKKKQNTTIIVLLNNFYFLDFWKLRDEYQNEGRILKKHHRSDALKKNSRKTDFLIDISIKNKIFSNVLPFGLIVIRKVITGYFSRLIDRNFHSEIRY